MGRPHTDLTGQRAGLLTVIERAPDVVAGVPLWICQCACGQRVTRQSSALIHAIRRGQASSCGCQLAAIRSATATANMADLEHRAQVARAAARANHLDVIDEAGKRYGRLTVIRRVETRRGAAVWECTCDCGQVCQVRGTRLRSGRQVSCGCARADADVRRAAWKTRRNRKRTATPRRNRA